MFIRLKNYIHSDTTEDLRLLSIHTIWSSNGLYGSEMMSSSRLAEGYTRPLDIEYAPVTISNDLVATYTTMLSKRKLEPIQ